MIEEREGDLWCPNHLSLADMRVHEEKSLGLTRNHQSDLSSFCVVLNELEANKDQ